MLTIYASRGPFAEPVLEQADDDLKKLEVVQEEDVKSMGSLQLEGSFVAPESNAFGHSFRFLSS